MVIINFSFVFAIKKLLLFQKAGVFLIFQLMRKITVIRHNVANVGI